MNSNTMKYIALIFLGVIISMTSCKKDFLDRPDQNNPTLDTYYTTAEQVDGATGLLYGTVWFPFMDRAFLSIGEIMGGTGITQGPGDYAPYQNFTVASNDAQVAKAWRSFYMVAGTSSVLIKAFENQKTKQGGDVAFLDKGIAEARFMRSMAYFYLARVFKDVPIVTDPVSLAASSDQSIPRYIQSDVLKFVIEDLKAAEAGLPETAAPGRVTKYSAAGLMAKVYLYMKDYDNAKAKALEVINSGKYALMNDYFTMFTTDKSNNNKEELFAFKWIHNGDYESGNHIQTNIGPSQLLDPVGAGGYSSVIPSLNLLMAFEPGDKRRQVVMEHGWTKPDWKNKNFPNGYVYDTASTDPAIGSKNATRSNSSKYVIGTGSNGDNVLGQSTDMDTYILRYADILLIYAEAVLGNNASTSDASALEAFNKVRRRAGLPERDAVTKDIILHERMIEFHFEGDYWYDVQRQGFAKAKEILWAQERGSYDWDKQIQHADVKAQFVSESQLYLPVPAAEITNAPILAQPPVKYY